MKNYDIYESIASRTDGDIYVGVVGPVRTGKSTFITRFMEKLVLPKLKDSNEKARMTDELPQSGAGKMIMTMQPRFVPNESVEVNLADNVFARVRLVDCVGYLIDGVSGHEEDGNPRLVKTPWQDEKITFMQASEIGTSKVITDHSTIGFLLTTDGSITDIPRANYTKAEERVVNELKELNKPFVIVLNSTHPEAEETQMLARAMQEKYGVCVKCLNVAQMEEADYLNLLEGVLYEFPVKKVNVEIPDFMRGLTLENEEVKKIVNGFSTLSLEKMKDYISASNLFKGEEYLLPPTVSEVNLATGELNFKVDATKALFYKTLSEATQTEIKDDLDLVSYITELASAKIKYDKIASALADAENKGYGIVVPTLEDMELYDPEISKKSSGSAVKLKAKASSLHIMKVDVEAEVTPTVGGTELGSLDSDGEKAEIWNTTMFGKTLTELAHDGIISKIQTFPEEAQVKMQRTMTKIANEGKGGIICILL